jgi:hypothetical protein
MIASTVMEKIRGFYAGIMGKFPKKSALSAIK